MNIRRLFLVFVFSLLLTSPPMLVIDQAYGWMCCSCAVCKYTPGCVCPGTPGYCGGYACPRITDDADGLLVITSSGRRSIDIWNPIYLTRLSGCNRLSVAVRILGDAVQSLKVEPFDLNNNAPPRMARDEG